MAARSRMRSSGPGPRSRRFDKRRVPVPAVGRGDAAVRAEPREGASVPDRDRDRRNERRRSRRPRRACRPAAPPVPGLADPNEKQEKGLLKNLAYRVLASEGVVSRNVAKRGSEQWGKDAAQFHYQWHQQLEAGLAEVGLGGKLKRIEHHVSHAANAYYTSGFDQALIVTLDGYGSGLAGSISTGPRRQDRTRPRPRVPALARHVLRVGHVGARVQAQPPRGQDRRPRRVRRSRSLGRHPAQALRLPERRLPHRRDQQHLLRAAAGGAVPEDRRRRRLPARARGSRGQVRVAVGQEDRASATWCSRAASSPTSS